MDLDSSSWVQSIYRRMRFTKYKYTSAKIDIPKVVMKEIEYPFAFDNMSRVEQYDIPDSLIISLNQTPMPSVLVESKP